jgi:ribosomal-protein-alanine N-acetyltransferase
MIVFNTERLTVRYLQNDDFDTFYAICSAPEVMHYMGDGKPLTAEQTRDWLRISRENYQKRGYGCFAIAERPNGLLIGFGGLTAPRPGRCIEIIYAFKKSHWGQGLAAEFARAMIETSFQRWNIPRIEASIDPRNIASIKTIQKLAMTFVRTALDENNLSTEYYALDNPNGSIH